MKKSRTQHTQEEKRIKFATMASVHKQALAEGNFIAAHVVAFSFLEDRVTAMDVVRGRQTGEDRTKFTHLMKRVRRLHGSGDISKALLDELDAATKLRNSLLHAAMWNLDVFSESHAKDALAVGRKVDTARRAQKQGLGV